MTIKICDSRMAASASTMALALLLISFCLLLDTARGQQCPSVCACKWKGGKQTVECIDKQLITIPENIDQNTQVLDMSGNNLQQLPRETFVRLDLLNLQKLYLRNCRLGHIDDEAFKGLTNLVELDLSHNLLTGIPSNTFYHIPSLRDVTLSKNPIQKIESLAFQKIPNLVKLDMSHCELSMIAPQAFEGLDLLHSLKLNGNKLSELRPRTVETLSRLHGVELHDNPWVCDCRLRAAKIWLTENNIPYPVTPICSGGPERILDRTFDELDIDDFACQPEILPGTRNLGAFSSENLTIECKTGAVPSPKVTWYRTGQRLVNNTAFSAFERVHIYETGEYQKTSRLVITNVQEVNRLEVFCSAENKAGTAEANFTVQVTMRTGITTFGNGQIAGLSIALVVLILFILLIILFLLVRLRRVPFSESKTPGQLDTVITTVSPTTTNNNNNNSIISSNNNNSNSINNNLLHCNSSNNNINTNNVVGKVCNNALTSTSSTVGATGATVPTSVALLNHTNTNSSSTPNNNHCYNKTSKSNSDVVSSLDRTKTASDMKIASTNNHINNLRLSTSHQQQTAPAITSPTHHQYNHHITGNSNSSSTTQLLGSGLSTNPVQKPPRLTDIAYTTSHYDANGSVLLASKYLSPSATTSSLLANFNNPDLINDTNLSRSTDDNFAKLIKQQNPTIGDVDRTGSGEYSRATGCDSLYPSGLWENSTTTNQSGTSPAIDFNGDLYSLKRNTSVVGSTATATTATMLNLDDEHSSAEFMCRTYPRPQLPSSQQSFGQYSNSSMDVSSAKNPSNTGYPLDYGLPMVPGAEHEIQKSFREPLQQPPGMPANAKTLRVWQRGGVPVLPPVTALKRALTSSRNSPDEGYQEGCGTDV